MTDDLISRDELRENMLYAMCGTGYQSVALREIELMPSVDAVPVRYGEWIDSHDPWTGGICSACGYQTGERMGHLKLHYRYCPNCGARMVKDE